LEWHSRGQRFDPAYLHQTLRKKPFLNCLKQSDLRAVFAMYNFKYCKSRSQYVPTVFPYLLGANRVRIIK
ncbi:hypothetical protein, partial [Intestinibacillus massiliensis]